MKKFILFSVFLIGLNFPAQHKENIFDEKQVSEAETQSTEAQPCDPNCPPSEDDLPIDNHISLLFIIAAGLIVYTATRRKGRLSKII